MKSLFPWRPCVLPDPKPDLSVQPIANNLVLPRRNVVDNSDRHQRFPFSSYSGPVLVQPSPELYPEFVIGTFTPSSYLPTSSGKSSSYDYVPPFIDKDDLVHYRQSARTNGVIPANIPRTLSRDATLDLMDDFLMDLEERIYHPSVYKKTRNMATIPWMNDSTQSRLVQRTKAIVLSSSNRTPEHNPVHTLPSQSAHSLFASRHSNSSPRFPFHSTNFVDHTPQLQMFHDRQKASNWTPDEKERFVLASLVHPRNYDAIARESLVNKTRKDIRDFSMFDAGYRRCGHFREEQPKSSDSQQSDSVPQTDSDLMTQKSPTIPIIRSHPTRYITTNPIQRWIRECSVQTGLSFVEETEEFTENEKIERNIRLRFKATSQDRIPPLPPNDFGDPTEEWTVPKLLSTLPLNRPLIPPFSLETETDDVFPTQTEEALQPEPSSLSPPPPPPPPTATRAISYGTRRRYMIEQLSQTPPSTQVDREQMYLFDAFFPPSQLSLYRNPKHLPNIEFITPIRKPSIREFIDTPRSGIKLFVLHKDLANVKASYTRRVGGRVNYSFFGNGLGTAQPVAQHHSLSDESQIPKEETEEPYGSKATLWIEEPDQNESLFRPLGWFPTTSP
ncbi:hypothetical protein BLNAU_3564 [Blattamonas nauphoetae]|uniref:Myb-like domain-containing protein n=1 Tax=Blattamonas nauphoetae TaxID=2049346 RepID=A0ABQ9YCE1_9EUKA|nr:hypothetical protein BLNAU_3564 [Blattamonas nauphoetae]